jgi:hypothetical protein
MLKPWASVGHLILSPCRPEYCDVHRCNCTARFPAETIATALERALALRCWSADGVEQLVRQEAAPSHASTALDPAVLARLPEVDIPLPDLHCFDQLLGEVPA